MRKIVIVDEYIPVSCLECEFFSTSGENATGKCEARDESLETRPERCPIRPLSLIERSMELMNPFRREEEDD